MSDDAKFRALLSNRVASLLEQTSSFQYAMSDARERIASLAQRGISLGYDLSELNAAPVKVTGLPHCGEGEATPDWVQIDGNMIFTYDSPTAHSREPVRWPKESHILIPTIVEDGIRKFDGYCPEPSMDEKTATLQ
jgi:hypothetical protein